MVSIKELTQAVFERLKSRLNDEIAVEYAPTNAETYKVKHPNGAALVSFASIDASEPDFVKQTVMFRFNIYLCLRGELDNIRQMELLDDIRVIMTSDFIIDGSRFYMTSQTRDYNESGIWYYSNNFILPQLLMQGN